MYFHHNGSVAWISIAKNACSSWAWVFDRLGWVKEDLFNSDTNLENLTFFGFLRNPEYRHTMGVVEYLKKTDQQQLLYDTSVNKLFVSAVFDQHSYSVSQMIPDSILNRTTFFIIDQTYYNYETLVKRFLNHHGVTIDFEIPRIYTAEESIKTMRQKLQELKITYPEAHGFLTKNFLDCDCRLYNKHLALQPYWHRPGDVCGQHVI